MKNENTENIVTVNNQTMDNTMVKDIIDNAKIALNNVKELLGITDHMMNKYLYIAEQLIRNGFSISDLKRIINSIYNFAQCNNIDIYDIDYSNTNINSKCIFFDGRIHLFKNGKSAGVWIRLDYYNNEIRFKHGSVHNYNTNITKLVSDKDELKNVIDEFTQGD